MATDNLGWTMAMMRAGYAARGLVYLAIAGFSLWAILRGGEAQGTHSALASLESTWWGGILLVVIAVGLLAFALWRFIDAALDLEDYGADGTGLLARAGITATGLVHVALAALAVSLLFAGAGGGESGGGSAIVRGIDRLMELPGGRVIVAAIGLVIVGAGGYQINKAWQQSYHGRLRVNRFTRNWNPVLRLGVAIYGLVIAVVGILFIYAAVSADPSEAGGVGAAFGWISDQAYGTILIAFVCAGLVGFALFCFVNALYRTIPKVADDGVETLAAALEGGSRSAN